MRNRAVGVLVATMTSLTMAACDSPGAPESQHAAPTGTATSAAPGTTPSSEFPELDLPAAARILVSVLHGTKATDTPPFDTPQMKYTVYVVCTGGGTVTVDDDEPKPIPCDGQTRRSHVITGARSTVVPIRPHGSVRWSVAVVDTDDFSFTTPTAG